MSLEVSDAVYHSQIVSRPNLDWVAADGDQIRIGPRPNLAMADSTSNCGTNENPSKWTQIRLFGLRVHPNRSQNHFQSIAGTLIP